MVSLTRFGIESSRFTIIAMLGLILLGISAYFDLSKREDPSITIRTVVVTAQLAGMSPIRMEELIVDPIERKAREISEVEDINVLISTGRAVINLNLYESVPNSELPEVFEDIRNKMNSLKDDLPAGTKGPLVNTDYGDVVVATVAVTGEGFDYRELRESAKALRKHLYGIEGVGKVSFTGVQEERIWLEINSRKLAAVGIQIQQVLDDLKAQNIILPAGQFDSGGTNLILEANGELEDIEAIKNVLTKVPNLEGNVRLADILNVRRGYEDPKNTPAYFDGKPAIMVGIQMTKGQDIQVLGARIKDEVDRFENTQAIGIEYNFSTYQETKVTKAVNEALLNVIQTAAVVLLVLILFLGWRPAVIVACIVPFTVMFTVITMGPMGIELQVVSIAAVILALGLLVDNGLVIVEDIQGQLDKGIEPKDASYRASKQFGSPLAVASITTVAAFLPLLLIDGTAGEYGYSLGAVVGLMLVGSWISAIYLLPPLCVWFAKKSTKKQDVKPSVLITLYGNLISKALPLSLVVVMASYVIVVLSTNLFSGVKQEMFPLSERNQYLIYMDMPKGTSITRTQEEALAVEAWLSNQAENPEVMNSTIYVGDGGPRFYLSLNPGDVNPASAFILVNTHDYQGALLASKRAQRYLLEQHPAARFKIKRLSMGGSESGIVEVKISGPSADKLLALAEQVEESFAKAPNLVQNENDWGNKVLKIVVDIAQNKARDIGVTSENISQIMDSFYSGSKVSEFRDDKYSIPIMLRAEKDFRDSLEDLQNLTIPANGRLISLDQVATFIPKHELSQLRRENQQRMIKVSAKSSTMQAAELLALIQPTLDELDLSGGYQVEIDGETANSQDTNSKLGAGLPYAFMVMLAALMFQFNSFRRVTIVFMTIPFIIVGVPMALLLANEPLSFFGTLGIISLAGIIINNAIVLIDQIDLDWQSLELKEAIISAAKKRVTPITLTTLTTVVGLTPMALSGGALFEPMATLMIGGLLIGSLISLFFVPAAFYLLFGTFSRLFRGVFRH